MRPKVVAAAVAVALLVAVGLRVGAVLRANRKPADRPVEAALVTAARVVHADVPERISVTGTVRARNDVEIFSKSAGRVESAHARIGDRVRSGQLLAWIEHKEVAWQAKAAEAAVEVARANLDGAKLEFDRTESLFKGGAAPPSQLDAARVRLSLAQAQLAQAEAAAGLAAQQLANARIESPIAGTVTRRPVDVGAQVDAKTVLFAVQDVAALKLESSVDAASFSRLRRGAPASVTVDALPGEAFAGKVTLLSPSLDPQSRRAAVEIEIDNAAGRLLPNMFAHVDIEVGVLRQAPVVPREALLEAAGGAVVYRIRDGRAEAVKPRLGPGDETRVAVLDGLAEGDVVATSGLAGLADGALVRVAATAESRVSAANP